MTFDGRTWTLQRTKPDFSPLHFCQRFTAAVSDDGSAITGEWQTSPDGQQWQRDFGMTYIRRSNALVLEPGVGHGSTQEHGDA
jgi:hypothetical protein